MPGGPLGPCGPGLAAFSPAAIPTAPLSVPTAPQYKTTNHSLRPTQPCHLSTTILQSRPGLFPPGVLNLYRVLQVLASQAGAGLDRPGDSDQECENSEKCQEVIHYHLVCQPTSPPR